MVNQQQERQAKTTLPNKKVKVYIGAPVDPMVAGSSYVDADMLVSYALQTVANIRPLEESCFFGMHPRYMLCRLMLLSLSGVSAERISSVHSEQEALLRPSRAQLSGGGGSVPTISLARSSGTSTPTSPTGMPSSPAST